MLSAHANAENTSTEIDLNPTVISGSRTQQKLSDVMTSVSVITKDDIDRLQPQDLSTLLQGEPGIETVRSGGLGMQTSIFMRGAESHQVLVLVDGLRISDEYSNSTPLESIPIAQVERVEILRGNASALYGPNAVGGVIQIFTKSGSGNLGAYGSISYGSRNTQNLLAGYNGKFNDTSYNFSYNHQQTDGFTTFNPAQNNPNYGQVANPINNHYESNNFSINLSQVLSVGHEVGIKLLASESKVIFDTGSNYNPLTNYASTTGLDYMEHLETKSLLSQIYSKDAITDFWNSTVSLGITNRTYLANYNDQDLIDQPIGTYNNHQSNFSWVNDFVLSNNQSLLVGLQSDHLTAHINDSFYYETFNGERTINSIFSGYTAKFNSVGLQANIRHDSINTGESATTGLFGLSYDLTTNWKIAGNISNAFSAPTPDQMYDPNYGNPHLKSERDTSQEISLQYLEANTLARAVIFNRDSRDLIVGNPNNNYQWENINKASNQGLEFTAKTLVGVSTIKFSATLQDPLNEITNTQLIRRAKEFGALETTYPIGAYTLGAQLFASGPTPDIGTQRNAGYSTVNLFANYKYNENWSAKIKIENLFDRNYQQSYGYNTPGFGAFLTLQYVPSLNNK